MKNNRLAIAMVELILAIVIMGIVLLSAPIVMNQVSASAYSAEDSRIADNLYSKISIQIQDHVVGSRDYMPRNGGFGQTNIIYSPLVSTSSDKIRLVTISLSSASNESNIVMSGFGIYPVVKRVKIK